MRFIRALAAALGVAMVGVSSGVLAEPPGSNSKMKIEGGAVGNVIEDRLGDFVAVYEFERIHRRDPYGSNVAFSPYTSTGQYEAVRIGNRLRISVSERLTMADTEHAGGLKEVARNQTWFFRDNRVIGHLTGANYTQFPQAGLILEALPPFDIGMNLVYANGQLLDDAEIEAMRLQQEVSVELEETSGTIVERSRTPASYPFAHGIWGFGGRREIESATGRLRRTEAGRYLRFNGETTTAFFPTKLVEVSRWVNEMPASVVAVDYGFAPATLDELGDNAAVQRLLDAGTGRQPAIELRMELTDVRAATASDAVAPADVVESVHFVRDRDIDPSKPVWSDPSAPGSSARLLMFNETEEVWKPTS